MTDRSDEGGDPACWAHLFDDEHGQDDRASDENERDEREVDEPDPEMDRDSVEPDGLDVLPS